MRLSSILKNKKGTQFLNVKVSEWWLHTAYIHHILTYTQVSFELLVSVESVR
jgi:hypothetical protein